MALVVALHAGAATTVRAAGDTLFGPFTVGMSVADVDTLAGARRLRWLAREIRYASDPDLSLFELRDTTAHGVLIYALTFERGRLQQVELHRNVAPEDASDFGVWIAAAFREIAATSEPIAAVDYFEARCRPWNGGTITTLFLVRGATYATIIASAGAPRAACQRC